MKSIASFVLVAAAATLSAPASAQFAKPEDAIKYRQSTMFVMSQHFGRVAQMANGRIPFDAKAAADNAAIAEGISKLPYAAFGDGTDKGNTKAKPEIWTDNVKFMAAAEKMQGDMTRLVVATKTGNIDAIKAAVGATGGSCKACHDNFRKE